MEFRELIAGFAARYDVAGLTVDARELVALGIGELTIYVQYVSEVARVLVYADLGAIPEKGAARFERTMLEANYLFRGTSGATLARHPEKGTLFLNWQEGVRALDVESFCALIEKFAGLARTWQELLAEFTAKAAASDEAEAPFVDAPPEEFPPCTSSFLRV